MNKKTKGLISGALGAALLLGAGGTFALWFDQAALGADVDVLATGNLELGETEVSGAWYWSRVSNTQFNHLLPQALEYGGTQYTFLDGSELVPGDAASWQWTSTDIEVLLSGDTIVAALYLDGVNTPITADAFAPLVLTWEEGLGELSITADGTVLLVDGLTAGNLTALDGFVAPTFTVTFPTDRPDGTFGHAPSAPLNGYGRNQTFDVIDLQGVEIRLQQVTNDFPTE